MGRINRRFSSKYNKLKETLVNKTNPEVLKKNKTLRIVNKSRSSQLQSNKVIK